MSKKHNEDSVIIIFCSESFYEKGSSFLVLYLEYFKQHKIKNYLLNKSKVDGKILLAGYNQQNLDFSEFLILYKNKKCR
ncbi:hypothetical protein [Nostoc sp. WHI]|uniref:hypothetical protein n=1 Tax=Nostoc sp. WHI TaxID=2650611 RepID=UPI0018C6828B|nr:hypothetical protein [Nostoc sp. WHI]MBG1269812.1 hypothetical protein [Nostoc sp. WHI]